MIDYSSLITSMIIVSVYFIVGIGGILLSNRAGHTNIVNED